MERFCIQACLFVLRNGSDCGSCLGVCFVEVVSLCRTFVLTETFKNRDVTTALAYIGIPCTYELAIDEVSGPRVSSLHFPAIDAGDRTFL
jgi:hypothetical protein